MAGVTGKVVPAISLYNFSQYTLPMIGRTCDEGAVKRTAAVCQASNATLKQMENKSGLRKVHGQMDRGKVRR